MRRADGTEEVHAAIVATPGHGVERGVIREYVTEHKGAMYAPHVVPTMDRIPLTEAGKPDKKLLSARLARATRLLPQLVCDAKLTA
ncbi:hypothetical protein [Streptomyces sp. NPDC004788]